MVAVSYTHLDVYKRQAETTLRLARDFKNIIAIKEASGNITQMDDIIKNKPCLLYTSRCV